MKRNESCVLSFTSWVVCICWPALSVRSCLIRASTSVAANFLVYDRLEVKQEAGVVLSSTVHGRCSGSSTAFSKITDGSLHQHIPLKQWDFLECTSVLSQHNFIWRDFNGLCMFGLLFKGIESTADYHGTKFWTSPGDGARCLPTFLCVFHCLQVVVFSSPSHCRQLRSWAVSRNISEQWQVY